MRELKRWGRIGFWLTGALVGCANKAQLPPQQEVQAAVVGVRTVKPEEKLAAVLVRATGVLRAKQEAVLSTPVTGTIAKVLVRVGDRVRKGQALVQLDISNVVIMVEQANAARAAAQAGYDAAKIEFDRVTQLRATGAAPAAALDRATSAYHQAEAGLAQATAGLKAAQENLNDHTLRAPFGGVVTMKLKDVGETVAMVPPTPIVAVVADQALEVRTPVPETLVDFIKVGTQARGTLSPSGKTFEAEVTVVGAVVDAASRTVEVLADVTSPITPEIRPGALVEVAFPETSQAGAPTGVYVPTQAVFSRQDKQYVVVVKGGVAEPREVNTQQITPGVVRVTSGLELGEDVVVESPQTLPPGARVQISSS